MPSAHTAPPASLVDEKSELRRVAFERRRELAAREAPAEAGRKIAERVLETIPIPAGTAVSAYWPMGDELDPRPLIERLHAAGCSVGLPIIVAKGQPLSFRCWTPDTRFVAGGFRTQVPEPGCPEVVPSLLVVPLLAFDRRGYRLGYGGGFYDRTLAKLRALGPVTAVGFAYAGQEVDVVPRDDYDQPLDWLATERSVVRLG
ncbi:MAG: 5-formyltetrahydrofolate cyclo-ligase [Rhodospirillaceae bacterium]|nr:5-formyltetrahydrofolate cyclo-ligase [Rhodospirillaceae bacterium]